MPLQLSGCIVGGGRLALHQTKEYLFAQLFSIHQCLSDILDNAVESKKGDFDVKIELPFDD